MRIRNLSLCRSETERAFEVVATCGCSRLKNCQCAARRRTSLSSSGAIDRTSRGRSHDTARIVEQDESSVESFRQVTVSQSVRPTAKAVNCTSLPCDVHLAYEYVDGLRCLFLYECLTRYVCIDVYHRWRKPNVVFVDNT